MKKQYFVIEGSIFKENGWREKDVYFIMDKFLEAIELVGGQAALGYTTKTEEEILLDN